MKYVGKLDGMNFKDFNFPDLASFQKAKASAEISNAAEHKANPMGVGLASTIMYIPESAWRIGKSWEDITLNVKEK